MPACGSTCVIWVQVIEHAHEAEIEIGEVHPRCAKHVVGDLDF